MDPNTQHLLNAQQVLETIYNEVVSEQDLSLVIKSSGWLDLIKVARVESPTTWRLVKGSDGEEEEMVFTVRGMITAKDLPPILQRPRITAARYKYLRQGVTITGLGIAKFDQAMATTTEIYGLFDRSFPDGQLASWMSTNTEIVGDFPGLDASNRYMVPKKEAPGVQHHPFTAAVNPKGLLEDMAAQSESIHTEENKVLYFTSKPNASGQRAFSAAFPHVYRIGDIVELQVSFIVVPLKGEQYKMITALHSIALLDGTFAQSASKAKCAQQPVNISGPRPLVSVKRRVGYVTPGIEKSGQSSEKKARMDVDEDSGQNQEGASGQTELTSEFSTHLHF